MRQPTSASEMNAGTQNIIGLGDGFDAFRTERLPDGNWLSLTGDAIAVDGQTLPVYDNAAVLWDSCGGQHKVYSPHPGGHFFPRWPDGSEFWPGQIFFVGNLGYTIGSRQLTVAGGSWTPMGAYGAVFDITPGKPPSFLRYFPTPSSGQDDTSVQWSAAVAYDGTYVYVHGVFDRPDQFHARDGGYIARVALNNLEIPNRWEFWAECEWSHCPNLATPTIKTGGPLNGTTSGYTLHKRPNGQWQVTTKAGGDMANELGRYVSTAPYGPWTWESLLTVGGTEAYLPGAAPSIPTTSGDLLVQWSRPGLTPQWAEVPQ